jgi:hypothetical protein
MTLLGPTFSLPANASRFFLESDVALSQPLGRIQLEIKEDDPFVFNSLYQSELIAYDQQYCTAVSAVGIKYRIPTLAYIGEILNLLPENPLVIDIGCGQGEFVLSLRNIGIEAIGYDPVLRLASQYLIPEYWAITDTPGDLYVMRCVLPHIQGPWEFISRIASSSPCALVLIEFQRLEWILENAIWYQISHDHVNVFSVKDFEARYEVVKSGTFSNGEWGWVLIKPWKLELCLKQKSPPVELKYEFSRLFVEKEIFLSRIKTLGREVIIWGAAGKGIVLANALHGTSLVKFAIDADSHRWNHYLEGSAVKVLSPTEAGRELSRNSIVLVCNPNHVGQVNDFLGSDFEVTVPRNVTHR